MTPDELAHVRDLDAAVWSRRWQILYGMADEWAELLGERDQRRHARPLAVDAVPERGRDA